MPEFFWYLLLFAVYGWLNGYLSIKLGKLEIIGGNRYDVNAEFDSVSGLKAGATVEIAGVEVGRVKGIALNGDRGPCTRALSSGMGDAGR